MEKEGNKMTQSNSDQPNVGIAFVNLLTAMLKHQTQKSISGSGRNMGTRVQYSTVEIAQLIFREDYNKYIPLLEKRATVSQQEAQEALQAIRNQDIGEVLLSIEPQMMQGIESITYHRAEEVRGHNLFKSGQELVDKVLSGNVSSDKDAEKFLAASHLNSLAAVCDDKNILFNNLLVREAIVTLLEAAYPDYQRKEASHRALTFEKIGQVRDEDLRVLLMDPQGRIKDEFIYTGLNLPITATKEEINQILYQLPRGIKNKKYLHLALGPALSRDEKGTGYKAEPIAQSLGVYINDLYGEFFEKPKPHMMDALAIIQKDAPQVKIEDYVQAAKKVITTYEKK